MSGGDLPVAPMEIETRQRPERVPFTFTPNLGNTLNPTGTIESEIRRSQGYDAIVGLVSGTTGFTVQILGAPSVVSGDGDEPGPFELIDSFPSAANPESGLQVATIAVPVKSAFIKARIVAGASKVASIKPTLDLVPIYAYKDINLFGFDGTNWIPVEVDVNGAIVVSGGVVGVSTDLEKVVQVQNIEQTLPLAGGASSPGTTHDMLDYESFGVSAYVKAAAGDPLDTTVFVENSFDGVNWDPVDTVNLKNLALGSDASLNRVYSVTRQFYRATLTNNGANPLETSRFGTMQKPV